MSEILGSLFKYLLALLAITAVVAVLYEALGTNKIGEAVSDVTSLQANITELYAGANGAGFDSSQQDLINAGVVPSSMISGNTISDPWGGAVTIVQATTTSGNQIQITFPSVPSSACTKLVMSLASAMASITVSGAVITTSSTQPTLSTVISSCNPTAGKTSVPIMFAFSANIGASSSSSSSAGS